MNQNHQSTGEVALINLVQPKKVVDHFGGNINEIKQWANLSTKDELIMSIKAFELEGLTDYLEVLNESLKNKK